MLHFRQRRKQMDKLKSAAGGGDGGDGTVCSTRWPRLPSVEVVICWVAAACDSDNDNSGDGGNAGGDDPDELISCQIALCAFVSSFSSFTSAATSTALKLFPSLCTR